MCCSQPETKDGPISRDVSCGSFPVTGSPSRRMPFPASGSHQDGQPLSVHSFDCWGPYRAMEKPQRFFRSRAVQPMVGTVNTASAEAASVSSIHASAEDPCGRAVLSGPSGRLMKNQSDAWLVASFCQLYRVTAFPPQRRDGYGAAPKSAASPRFTP